MLSRLTFPADAPRRHGAWQKFSVSPRGLPQLSETFNVIAMRSAPAWLLFALIICMNVTAQSSAELSEIWENGHITKILPSNVRHRDLQNYLGSLAHIGVPSEEVGKSTAGREIYRLQWGNGPLKIFLWSQMHGDEPTATSALIDLFAILQNNRGDEWVKRIESAVTIRAVPMLNPDGAEL
ncbi:MAG TPA: hypothetical protein DEA22_14720, partial [Blastocatellia bacterium]|nr:hypothetical protein [Blastocatellia bacterium]